MKISYSSNNSGGDWWLKDKDWYALEKAGWKVEWFKDDKDGIYGNNKRWLGALASRATKDFDSIEDARSEFERITGQNADDEGCDCCGQPHNFYVER